MEGQAAADGEIGIATALKRLRHESHGINDLANWIGLLRSNGAGSLCLNMCRGYDLIRSTELGAIVRDLGIQREADDSVADCGRYFRSRVSGWPSYPRFSS